MRERKRQTRRPLYLRRAHDAGAFKCMYRGTLVQREGLGAVRARPSPTYRIPTLVAAPASLTSSR